MLFGDIYILILLNYSYLSHDAGVDGLDADVLAVQIKSVHKGLGAPNELIRLSSA